MASLPKPAASAAPAVEFMAVPTDGEGVYDAQRATWTARTPIGGHPEEDEGGGRGEEGSEAGYEAWRRVLRLSFMWSTCDANTHAVGPEVRKADIQKIDRSSAAY